MCGTDKHKAAGKRCSGCASTDMHAHTYLQGDMSTSGHCSPACMQPNAITKVTHIQLAVNARPHLGEQACHACDGVAHHWAPSTLSTVAAHLQSYQGDMCDTRQAARTHRNSREEPGCGTAMQICCDACAVAPVGTRRAKVAHAM